MSLKVYYELKPSTVKRAFGAFIMLLFAVGAISLLLASLSGDGPEPGSRRRLLFYLAAYVGPPLFLGLFVWSLLKVFDKRPLMVIDDEGIELPSSNMPKIVWSEIADVAPMTVGAGKFLSVVPRNFDALAERLPDKRKKLDHNFKTFRSVAMIPEQWSPVKLDKLMEEIGPYCRAMIAQHAPAASLVDPPPPRMQV
jgi:hypothetical protein